MSESNETATAADEDATRNNQDDDETGAAAQENQTGDKDGDDSACALDRSRSSSAGTLVLKSGMVLPKCVHKCNDEQYADMRETVRTMMFLISERLDVLRTSGRGRWF